LVINQEQQLATAERLRVVPLGGLGRIGGNITAYESDRDLMVVDCGVDFPTEMEPGVRLVLPDAAYLKKRREKLRGYVVTHGHEDHIGALPFLLGELPAPIYAPRFARLLIERKLGEMKVAAPELHTIRDRQPFSVGGFQIDPIPVTHSIPDSIALAITTGVGRIIHMGDFKIDPEPLDLRNMDLEALRSFGEQGVTLLLSDSTNAGRPGHTWSEAEVRRRLTKVVQEAPARLLFSTFSSNIDRLSTILHLSAQAGRKVIPVGRSVEQNIQMAREEGYIRLPPRTVLSADHFDQLPPHAVTVVAAGCQGEPRSALARIAAGEHGTIRMAPGDRAILSSRRIPGNELAIGAVVNALLRLGLDVVDDHTAGIHASGHAFSEEQRKVLEICKPRYFVPLHGELRHMLRHAAIAEQAGVLRDRIFVLETGAPLRLLADGNDVVAARDMPVPTGRVYVQGDRAGDINDVVLRDRLNLAENGFATCTLTVNNRGELLAPPTIATRGVIHVDSNGALLADAVEAVAAAVRKIRHPFAEGTLETEARASLRRFFRHQLGCRPVVVVTLATVA